MVSLRELLGLNLQIYLFQSPGDVENENRDLAQKIKNSRPDYDPDIIAGALRGGLWALRIFLDNYFQKAAASKDYEVVNLSFYGEVNQPVTFLLKRGLSSDVADKELLWVEDLSDTGLSFLKLLHHTYEKGLEEKKRSNCFSEERYQYLTGRLNELKRILDEKDGKAAREFRESGFMKDFEDIVHVTTAAAYVKADTAFIPNFFNRMVSSSCWIASSYEGQEVVGNIMEQEQKNLEKEVGRKITPQEMIAIKRMKLMRTGIPVRRQNDYLGNLRVKRIKQGKDVDGYHRLTSAEQLKYLWFGLSDYLQFLKTRKEATIEFNRRNSILS